MTKITQFINHEPTFFEEDCKGFGWQFYILGVIKNELTDKHGSFIAEEIMKSMNLLDMEPDALRKVIGVMYLGRIFRSYFSESALKLLETAREIKSGMLSVTIELDPINCPMLRIESWEGNL